MGFEYFQELPFESFRVPDHTSPLAAASALLAFAAYPSLHQLRDRQLATEAFQAWTFRQALKAGYAVKSPQRLNRKRLPPEYVLRRVCKAARRIEYEALDIVHIGMDVSFERSGGYQQLAGMLASYLKARSATIRVPKGFGSETRLIRAYLRRNRSSSALLNEEQLVRDFRRRIWKVYLPALPLLTALHMDVLEFDPFTGEHKVHLPGHGWRYLAISLLSNPDIWVPSIITHTALRHHCMRDQFPANSFAEILGEDGGSRFSPPDTCQTP